MTTPIFLNIDVNLDFSNTRDISVSVGVDMPTVYIGQEIRKGQPYEPVAIELSCWMFMGGKSEIYHNCVISNKLNLQNLDTLSESVDCFRELETFATRPKTDLPFYRKTNKRL